MTRFIEKNAIILEFEDDLNYKSVVKIEDIITKLESQPLEHKKRMARFTEPKRIGQ